MVGSKVNTVFKRHVGNRNRPQTTPDSAWSKKTNAVLFWGAQKVPHYGGNPDSKSPFTVNPSENGGDEGNTLWK